MGELRMLLAAVRAITFRPLPDDVGFTSLKTSSYGAIIVGVVFATLAEMVAIHLGLSYYLGDGFLLLHLGITALHVYAILWLIGDWRLMKESRHVLADGALRVHLGQRWRGVVPLSAIREVRMGEVREPDALQGEKRPDHVVAVTPFDTPNVTLLLDEPVTLETYFGFSRTGTEVQLYLDEPARLGDAVNAHA